jgi:hypothetical protein
MPFSQRKRPLADARGLRARRQRAGALGANNEGGLDCGHVKYSATRVQHCGSNFRITGLEVSELTRSADIAPARHSARPPDTVPPARHRAARSPDTVPPAWHRRSGRGLSGRSRGSARPAGLRVLGYGYCRPEAGPVGPVRRWNSRARGRAGTSRERQGQGSQWQRRIRGGRHGAPPSTRRQVPGLTRPAPVRFPGPAPATVRAPGAPSRGCRRCGRAGGRRGSGAAGRSPRRSRRRRSRTHRLPSAPCRPA